MPWVNCNLNSMGIKQRANTEDHFRGEPKRFMYLSRKAGTLGTYCSRGWQMTEEKRYMQQPGGKSTLWAKRGCQQSSRGVLIFLLCKLSTLIPGSVSDRNQIFSVLDTCEGRNVAAFWPPPCWGRLTSVLGSERKAIGKRLLLQIIHQHDPMRSW